ncbi:MAG: T9SS type A sorting domain-containing protein [Bacteroidia bacterium]|nr:T9SS type A sorting domain-containing protein [Bacteroidia bacterium]
MRKPTFLTCVLCILISKNCFAQNYTWKKGSNSINQTGMYGTMGVPAATTTPGSRNNAVSWTDASGKFWLFGGFGNDAMSFNQLNDLWKYDPLTNQWTFIKGNTIGAQSGVYGTIGVSAVSNNPGSRSKAVSWRDANGDFWLFGGNGFDGSAQQGFLNDLWKYSPSTNQWTWMKGSANIDQPGVYGTLGVASAGNTPGARQGAVSWTDASGNLWLFGGFGYEATSNLGLLNDLWKYNIASNQWTWVRGSNSYDQNGTYGTLGVPSALNNPGGRAYQNAWTDASGNFWLLGGLGYPAAGVIVGHLNDLWKYNPLNNQWTWINGSNGVNTLGVYGTQGIPSAANFPGSRVSGVTWTDASGDLWLMGGYAMGYLIATVDFMNDLWRYHIATNEWTWIKGGNTISQAGVYGTQGIPSALNTPGGRDGAVAWQDNSGSFWLFGGNGYDTNSQTSSGNLNDLWKFGSCNSQTLSVTASPSVLCEGDTAILSASGATLYSWNNQQAGSSITVSPSGSTNFTVQSADPNGCGNFATFSLVVNPLPSVTAMSSDPWACFGYTVYLSAFGASTYTWNTNQTGAIIQVTVNSTLYSVIGTSTAGCTDTASVSQVFVICEGLNENQSQQEQLSVFPNPSNGDLTLTYLGETIHTSLKVFNGLGQCVFETFNVRSGDKLNINLSKGLYTLFIESKSHSPHVMKWVVE